MKRERYEVHVNMDEAADALSLLSTLDAEHYKHPRVRALIYKAKLAAEAQQAGEDVWICFQPKKERRA